MSVFTVQTLTSTGRVCAITETTGVIIAPSGRTFYDIDEYPADSEIKVYYWNGAFRDTPKPE